MMNRPLILSAALMLVLATSAKADDKIDFATQIQPVLVEHCAKCHGAEKAMGKLVRTIEDRAEDNKQAADLVRDQNGFAAQRDELCRDYAKESLHGYCALRVTEARTALLQTRLDELSPATASKTTSEKSKKAKSRKSAKEP